MMHVGQTSLLSRATLLAQAKNYSGAGKWFDEISGTGYFQPGSVLGSYIGPVGYVGANALFSPVVAGNYASSPDAAALDITGDLSMWGKIRSSDYTSGATQYIGGKYTTTGNQRSYNFYVSATGELGISLSNDGTAATTVVSTTLLSSVVSDGVDVYVGATRRDSDNRIQFWYSLNGTTYTQLGTDVTHTTTDIYSSTAVITVAAVSNVGHFNGSVYRFSVWNGLRDFNAGTGGTLAFDANFEAQATGTTSFIESSSNAATVTVVSTGADTNDPLFLPHSTSQNPFGAGVDYVVFPGTSVNDRASASLTFGGEDHTIFARVYQANWTAATTSPITGGDGATEYRRHLGRVGSNLAMRISASGTGAGLQQIAHGITGSGIWWIKSEWVQSTKTWTSWKSNEATNDPLAVTSWTSIGSRSFSDTPSTYTGSQCIGRGFTYAAHDAMNGYVSRVTIQQGLHSASTLSSIIGDFNPSGGTINSTATSLTGTGDGLTWTINRASTGRKTAWVERDRFLLGTDDRFALTGITPPWSGTEEDFTMLIAFRYFGTTIGGGKILFGNGRVGVANTPAGAAIATDFSNRLVTRIQDGTTGIAGTVIAVSSFNGTQSGFAAVYDPSAETIKTVYTASAGVSVSSFTTGALSDLGSVSGASTWIGYQSTDAVYTDFEVVGVAAFAGQLSDADIQSAYQELYA